MSMSSPTTSRTPKRKLSTGPQSGTNSKKPRSTTKPPSTRKSLTRTPGKSKESEIKKKNGRKKKQGDYDDGDGDAEEEEEEEEEEQEEDEDGDHQPEVQWEWTNGRVLTTRRSQYRSPAGAFVPKTLNKTPKRRGSASNGQQLTEQNSSSVASGPTASIRTTSSQPPTTAGRTSGSVIPQYVNNSVTVRAPRSTDVFSNNGASFPMSSEPPRAPAATAAASGATTAHADDANPVGPIADEGRPSTVCITADSSIPAWVRCADTLFLAALILLPFLLALTYRFDPIHSFLRLQPANTTTSEGLFEQQKHVLDIQEQELVGLGEKLGEIQQQWQEVVDRADASAQTERDVIEQVESSFESAAHDEELMEAQLHAVSDELEREAERRSELLSQYMHKDGPEQDEEANRTLDALNEIADHVQQSTLTVEEDGSEDIHALASDIIREQLLEDIDHAATTTTEVEVASSEEGDLADIHSIASQTQHSQHAADTLAANMDDEVQSMEERLRSLDAAIDTVTQQVEQEHDTAASLKEAADDDLSSEIEQQALHHKEVRSAENDEAVMSVVADSVEQQMAEIRKSVDDSRTTIQSATASLSNTRPFKPSSRPMHHIASSSTSRPPSDAATVAESFKNISPDLNQQYPFGIDYAVGPRGGRAVHHRVLCPADGGISLTSAPYSDAAAAAVAAGMIVEDERVVVNHQRPVPDVFYALPANPSSGEGGKITVVTHSPIHLQAVRLVHAAPDEAGDGEMQACAPASFRLTAWTEDPTRLRDTRGRISDLGTFWFDSPSSSTYIRNDTAATTSSTKGAEPFNVRLWEQTYDVSNAPAVPPALRGLTVTVLTNHVDQTEYSCIHRIQILGHLLN